LFNCSFVAWAIGSVALGLLVRVKSLVLLAVGGKAFLGVKRVLAAPASVLLVTGQVRGGLGVRALRRAGELGGAGL